MKLRMEATTVLSTFDGVPARLWVGMTEGGTACRVWVCGLEARADDDVERFEREMLAKMPEGRHRPLELAV